MAKDGLRVLGVAKTSFKMADGELPKEQHDFAFKFMGLIGFIDPVRPNVSDAVNECYNAGIRVVMITGDYPLDSTEYWPTNRLTKSRKHNHWARTRKND